ncbi:MAG: hypothetical protein WBA74_19985, partial [Cyclobacteriaceae bacterium]
IFADLENCSTNTDSLCKLFLFFRKESTSFMAYANTLIRKISQQQRSMIRVIMKFTLYGSFNPLFNIVQTVD